MILKEILRFTNGFSSLNYCFHIHAWIWDTGMYTDMHTGMAYRYGTSVSGIPYVREMTVSLIFDKPDRRLN